MPGASITATNTANGQKSLTYSDLNGEFLLQLPIPGRYAIQADMVAFAAGTQEVTVTDASTPIQVNLELTLLSRTQHPETQPRSLEATRNRGPQYLSLLQAEGVGSTNAPDDAVAPAGIPIPGVATDVSTESIAVSGANSGGAFSGMSTDEIRQRMQDSRDQRDNTGFGGPGGGAGFPGGGGRGGGGGGFRINGGRAGFNVNHPHGSLFYTVGDSAFDATPYSLTGQPSKKPSYIQNNFGGNLGAPLKIPILFNGGDKIFYFINYSGSQDENPYDAFSTVPTLAERNGNFSQSMVSNGRNAGMPVEIFDPQTHILFPNNTIPSVMLNQSAVRLLPFIPMPNLPGDTQNFHYTTSVAGSNNNLNVRLIHNFGGANPGVRRRGPVNNLNFGFHYQSSDAKQTSPFPSVSGSSSVRSFDVPIGYVRSFGKLTNNMRVDFNRSRTKTSNLYAFSQDIAQEVGITRVSQNPFDWGIPNLSFTNFNGLNDINPLLRRDQTLSASDFMIWNHGKHTFRWGGDFRRIQLNTETDSNARGSFTFTGSATASVVNGVPVQGTGFDFADFLLGLPQLTSVQFGANNYHFRGNSWDLFFQDEWHLRGNLTLNLGLRYEYVSPFTETNNQIVNLDAAPGFTNVAPVQPGHSGPFSGIFPETLVKPDRNNFAPRLGIAWKADSKTVVRSGYGINYNTGAYSNIVQQLAFQPPFSTTQTNITSPALPLTLQDGFPVQTATVTNNYGVDKNYRLGYVQIWNLDIQHEFRPDLILNLDYTGTKGTHLDTVEAPNRTATGLLNPAVQPYLFETSNGDSKAQAGSVRMRKRLQHGLSIGGTYAWSKSIDDASTIGGGATVVAQNAFDLAAERGLSSFDQTHRFVADYLWELPFGHDRHWLKDSSLPRAILGDWQLSGNWTIASGLPFTARVLGDFNDVNRGSNGTLRADVTGIPIALPSPSVTEWFNTAAFTQPTSGEFGDAGRNTIRGPGSLLFNMALTKVIPLNDTRVVEVRAQFANIFNTPQFTSIDTVVNSPTFGRVIGVGSMRKIQITTRFRF